MNFFYLPINNINLYCISDTCTALSKELCLRTVEGSIINYMLHFLQYSNQSQPSTEAREPAIRVLTNLLKYQETSWRIWMVSIFS